MLGQPEFVENPEPRCPCALVLDVSSSMSGKPIKELNKGVHLLAEELRQDPVAAVRVEPAITTFGGRVEIRCEFGTVDDFQPPTLRASGDTPMGEAIIHGIDALERRKEDYRSSGTPYYRPWLFLITDGAPTDSWRDAARLVHAGELEGRFSFFAVGVEGATMDTLRQIAPPSRPPLMLKGLQFSELFKWISASMRNISCSRPGGGEQLALPPVDGWAQCNS